MRVLLSCGADGWGGLEGQVLLLADAYVSRGVRTTLLVAPRTPLETRSRAAGYETLAILPRGSRGLPRAVAALGRLLRTSPDVVVHAHEGRDLRALAPALLWARRDTALYVTRHMGFRHDRHDPWHRLLYGRVRRLYAISSFVAEDARRVLPMDPERILVRPPGIDLGRFDPRRVDRRAARARFGWADEDTVIGMLGRVTARKGHEDFLEAASRLLPSRPELRFVLVGSAGRDVYEKRLENGLRERVRELGPRVSWLPATDRPEDVYAALDVFVFPSHAEAFGLALVEAMAMGRPVVAAAAAGVLDIVTDGTDGLLFRPGDGAHLAERLTTLLDRPDRGEDLARKARMKVADRWEIKRISLEYLNDFQSLE